MSNRHELHAYEYITHPYEAVRMAVLADPLAVIRSATSTLSTLRDGAAGAELHAKAGALEIGAEVAIEIRGIEDRQSCVAIAITWSAKRRPGLFPTMTGIVSIYPLTPTETQLEFSGTYDPPFGVVGDALDTLAMRSFAKQSVNHFTQDIAMFLRSSIGSGSRSAIGSP